ncbi:Ser/Thr protein kinase RdoA (MazF antagonist) [Paenibacillus sp. V4I9]|uniref:phosphotransferase enzyme family protein n=1 Tax=Paenibacillus sp. V4I9 TaxID=3042308 RepID=UPI0027893481|nr:aminoglycoside phosphotransferase family protein [Paenibacillus sp. V4I9]MDQ0887947.1 Ser/Thr protein kinase RdoA (MazF antagonist) [Paenibacillus sp. V4I9]
MDNIKLLQVAVKQYGYNPEDLVVEKELQLNTWHGDLHFKIHLKEKSFSARFTSHERYEISVFVKLTDEVLTEQIKYCNYLRESGIPFMKHRSTVYNEPFTLVNDGEKEWRFVLFEWIEGEHITHCTESVSEKFSKLARKIHDISVKFESEVFTKESHVYGSEQFLEMIRRELGSIKFTARTDELLQNYISLVEYNIEKAKSESLEFIVQSDLNNLNILWDSNGEIIGIVDFESITYTDRVEGLAWLIKWYSRPHGIGSHEMSPALGKAVLRGYEAKEILNQSDFSRLPSLLWLSGCLNWNFTAQTINLIKNNEDILLKEHLTKYLKRGEKLVSLI